MPFKVREVLLVASPFDAFILEEDGLLTEQVFNEYKELYLSASPRVTQVATGEEAMEKLKVRRYDLILVVPPLKDGDLSAFGQRVKRLRPGRRVMVLALDIEEIRRSGYDPEAGTIDGAFVWTGSADILFAIIKFAEDLDNINHDIEHGNVRVIIIVEDSPSYYSLFLGILYRELMKHARYLYKEGVNEALRRMYMSSRPKIVHATSYDQGLELFQRYQHNVLAVISDVGLPRGGSDDRRAGLALLRHVREAESSLPLLLQSAEPEMEDHAAELGAAYVDKNDPHLLEQIGYFLETNLGFGDFVFRNAEGHEIDRATDLRELLKKIETVAPESLEYHASQHHFSIWLMARSEFELAEALRPMVISTHFGDVEEFRRELVGHLRAARYTTRHGAITDFDRQSFEQNLMTRLGEGSMGGKARGIAFMYRQLSSNENDLFPDLPVLFPKTVVITSDHFDTFVEQQGLRHFAVASDDDAEIARRFLAAPLDKDLERDLYFLVENLDGPLAVRSSSLLEDSLHLPFAGVYNTLMIPNNAQDMSSAKDLARCHRELCAAIKMVYASTFSQNAKSYLRTADKRVEEEKMAVIIQPLVGQRHGGRFYPSFAGVAESYNFYPLGPQKAEDGVAHVALGLGSFVVDGGRALRFNPHMPGVLPPFASVKALLHNTQRHFFALDLNHTPRDLEKDLLTTIRQYELEAAEADGTLLAVGSVFSADDRRVRDDLSLPGPRVVTFNNVLRHRSIPLAQTLCNLLKIAEEGLGGPVELEFACDMGDWGRRVRRGHKIRLPSLYLLQVRPFAGFTRHAEDFQLSFSREESLCVSSSSLGHGIDKELRDIVYVRPDRWQAAHNKTIAGEVGELNQILRKERRPYVLIGPGRWGTADEWLGIPVQWAQISGVKVLVEASPAGYDVEPSQGSHFFQNITSRHLGYVTLPAGVEKIGKKGDFLDWAWLDAQQAERETEHLRHIRLEKPLTLVLNGRKGRSVIAKPGALTNGRTS